MALGPIQGRRQQGTGFQGVRKLIGANQGQSNLGSNILNRISGVGNQAEQAIGNETNEFNKGVQTATVGKAEGAQNILNRAMNPQGLQGLEYRKEGGDNINPMYYNGQRVDPNNKPQAVQEYLQKQAADRKNGINSGPITDEDVKTFNQAGTYTGPRGLSGNAIQQVGTAGQIGAAGTGQLLQQQVRNKAYNPSLRRFDETLLQRDPNLNKIKEKQIALQGISKQYDEQDKLAKQQAITAEKNIQKQQSDITDKLKGEYTKTTTDVDSQLTEAQGKQEKLKASLQEHLSKGGLTEEDMATLSALGITKDMNLGAISPKDLANLISTNSLTKESLMTPEQLNKLQALGKLSGNQVAGFNPELIGKNNNLFQITPENMSKITNQFNDTGDTKYGKLYADFMNAKNYLNQFNQAVQDKKGNLDTSGAQRLNDAYNTAYRNLKDYGVSQGSWNEEAGRFTRLSDLMSGYSTPRDENGAVIRDSSALRYGVDTFDPATQRALLRDTPAQAEYQQQTQQLGSPNYIPQYTEYVGDDPETGEQIFRDPRTGITTR